MGLDGKYALTRHGVPRKNGGKHRHRKDALDWRGAGVGRSREGTLVVTVAPVVGRVPRLSVA